MTRPCRSRFVAGLVLWAVLGSSAARAAEAGNEWRQWRGPHLDGSSEAKNLPEKFDEKTNVRWTTALPGNGSGTPVVCADRVFVSVLDKASKKLLAMCVSRKDGHILWQKEIAEGFAKNDRNNLASPSPVCDEKAVWFYYGTGDLVAFDHDGNQKWARNIAKDFGPLYLQWIYGSSPLLYDGKLIIQVYRRDRPIQDSSDPKTPAESFLLALDPQTGKDIWKHDRPNDALLESKESYGTPVGFEVGGKKFLFSIGGDVVTGNDADSGEEIWRCGGWNLQKNSQKRVVAGVMVARGLVIASPPKGEPIFAIKPEGSGNVTSTHTAWTNPKLSSDVCVPLYYKEKLYVLNGDAKTLYRVEPASGKIEATLKLGGNDVFRASPTAADGKIYCMNEAGEVWVIKDAGEKLEVAHQTDLGGGSNAASRSSIVLVDGEVIVRTAEKLWCFGAK